MLAFNRHRIIDFLWDLWCLVSIVGIWPRFIEPNLLATSKMQAEISDLPEDLEGLKILQISDLHFHSKVPDRFLRKISRRVEKLAPDLILFTGDFICHAQLEDKERLKRFLQALKAPHGLYSVFGNHDYEAYVGINEEGQFDLCEGAKRSFVLEGLKRVFRLKKNPRKVQGRTNRTLKIGKHTALVALLEETDFTLLENRTEQVSIGQSKINICGLGDFWAGRCRPDHAFQAYDENYPGLILSHNPDSFQILKQWPGDFIFSGHTHGGQVNLPFMEGKFIYMEHLDWMKGLVEWGSKRMYVNRGLGSHRPFRFLARPELFCLELKGKR